MRQNLQILEIDLQQNCFSSQPDVEFHNGNWQHWDVPPGQNLVGPTKRAKKRNLLPNRSFVGTILPGSVAFASAEGLAKLADIGMLADSVVNCKVMNM